jgi:TolA-binding protein
MRALVCVVVIALGCGNKQEAPPKAEQEAAAEVANKGEQRIQIARKEADDARIAVETLQADAEALIQRVNAAIDAVANAQNDNDRASARAALLRLQREKAEIEARIAEAKAAAARAERLKGVKISKECLDNPLARGCE